MYLYGFLSFGKFLIKKPGFVSLAFNFAFPAGISGKTFKKRDMAEGRTWVLSTTKGEQLSEK